MKLISRKSLVAVACSAAMITGATVAPAMAEEAPATTTANKPAGISSDISKAFQGSSDTKEKTTTAAANEQGKNNGSAATPKEMGEWAKAIAAIISTLTAIWTFVQKFLLKK